LVVVQIQALRKVSWIFEDRQNLSLVVYNNAAAERIFPFEILESGHLLLLQWFIIHSKALILEALPIHCYLLGCFDKKGLKLLEKLVPLSFILYM